MSQYAIIVAGGIGSRMGAEVPKQFLLLNGIPILMHTIRSFENYEIIVVLPEDQHKHWSTLCDQYHFKINHQVIGGGNTRFKSVKNGLRAVPETGFVAIHDGVRPLISSAIIQQSFDLAKKYGNAITAVPLKDSIREVTLNANQAKDRSNYQLVQTPQTFKIELIKEAYKQKESALFTDDASVLESDGTAIHLFNGSYSNIKITTPDDLKIAESLVKN